MQFKKAKKKAFFSSRSYDSGYSPVQGLAPDLQNRIHDSQSRHRYFYDIVPVPYVSSALKLSPRQVHILHKSGLKPRYSPLLQYHTAIHAADVMMTTVTWGWRMPGRTWTGLLISQHLCGNFWIFLAWVSFH